MFQMQLFLSLLCLSNLMNTFTLKKSLKEIYLAFCCTKFEYIFLEKFWICCCGLRHRIAGWIGGSQDCTGLGAHHGWKWLTHSGHISTPLPFISLDFLPFKYVVFYFRGSNPWLTPVYQIHFGSLTVVTYWPQSYTLEENDQVLLLTPIIQWSQGFLEGLLEKMLCHIPSRHWPPSLTMSVCVQYNAHCTKQFVCPATLDKCYTNPPLLPPVYTVDKESLYLAAQSRAVCWTVSTI